MSKKTEALKEATSLLSNAAGLTGISLLWMREQYHITPTVIVAGAATAALSLGVLTLAIGGLYAVALDRLSQVERFVRVGILLLTSGVILLLGWLVGVRAVPLLFKLLTGWLS